MRPITSDDLLDLGEVADMLHVKPSSLRSMLSRPERHRRIDGMPSPVRQVSEAPVWDRRRIEAWLAKEQGTRGDQPPV